VSITLAQLERETARRVGPYAEHQTDRQLPSTASFNWVNFPQLRSDMGIDLVTNLWLLRRGASAADRQRLVSTYDSDTGRVLPERPWSVVPPAGETCEFHHLNPEQELRVAVLAGLRRCFLPDNVRADPTQLFGGLDLTAQFPWLTDPWQIARVRYGWLSPFGDAPWDSYTRMGHLILIGMFGNFLPMSVWVEAWRPAWSWVNGDESDGPTSDDDVLEVDLDYAASAAHIEAWHRFPARLQAAAAGGLQATQTMAAQEFERMAGIFGPSQRPVSIGFREVVRLGSGGWINGPW